jgi:hypothetical protein
MVLQPGIRAVFSIQRVLHADRERFEQYLVESRHLGVNSSLHIHDMGALSSTGAAVISSNRSEYFPVLFHASRDGTPVADMFVAGGDVQTQRLVKPRPCMPPSLLPSLPTKCRPDALTSTKVIAALLDSAHCAASR